MSTDRLPGPTARSRVRRLPKRAAYDRAVIDSILDESLIGHVGFLDGHAPCVIPTAIVRVEDHVYVHGSRLSRLARVLESGASVCIEATLLDGIVVARSGFHSSMNYRSVVLFGTAERVVGQHKLEVLDALIDKLIPGRRNELRRATAKELRATSVLRVPISEASAKVRGGPPADDKADYALPVWAGVVPLALVAGTPEPCPRLPDAITAPAYIRRYRGVRRRR